MATSPTKTPTKRAVRSSTVKKLPVKPRVTKTASAATAASAKSAKPAEPANKPEARTDVVAKSELIARVAARSGLKKKDAKAAIEAVMAVLAESLLDEKTVVAQPVGKLIPVKSKVSGKAQVITTRLRLTPKSEQGDKTGKEALAEVGE